MPEPQRLALIPVLGSGVSALGMFLTSMESDTSAGSALHVVVSVTRGPGDGYSMEWHVVGIPPATPGRCSASIGGAGDDLAFGAMLAGQAATFTDCVKQARRLGAR